MDGKITKKQLKQTLSADIERLLVLRPSNKVYQVFLPIGLT